MVINYFPLLSYSVAAIIYKKNYFDFSKIDTYLTSKKQSCHEIALHFKILKASKSPLKSGVLQDLDPNSLDDNER